MEIKGITSKSGLINTRILHNSFRLAYHLNKLWNHNQTNVVRISSRGELCVNDDSLGNRFCAKMLSETFQRNNNENRSVYIVCYPNASPLKIANLIRGLALGDFDLVRSGRGLVRVITTDYGITHILDAAKVDYIKAGPSVNINTGGAFRIDEAMLRNPQLEKTLNCNLHRTQRNKILEGIVHDTLHGVLDGFSTLETEEKNKLIAQLAQIDFKHLAGLLKRFKLFIECVATSQKPDMEMKKLNVSEYVDRIEPAHMDEIADLVELSEKDKEGLMRLQKKGEERLKMGKHALFVPAAGKGARFGGDKPKGIYNIFKLFPALKPARAKEEFSFLASAIKDALAFQKKYNVKLPVIIMTSPENRKDIEAHLEKNEYFGYEPQHIFLVYQTAVLPKIYPRGNSLAFKRDSRGSMIPELDMAATGHGFLLEALQNQTVFDNIKNIMDIDVETVTVRNVDNMGGTVSDNEFAQLMGSLIEAKEEDGGAQIAIEVTDPAMKDADVLVTEDIAKAKGGGRYDMFIGQKVQMSVQANPGGSVVWDKKLKRNILMEGQDFIEPADSRTWTHISVNSVPFNTLTTTLFRSALNGLSRAQLPWYIVKRDLTVFGDPWGRVQFEQMWGDISKIAKVQFTRVHKDNRFFEVKKPEQLRKAVENFLRSCEEKGIAIEESPKQEP